MTEYDDESDLDEAPRSSLPVEYGHDEDFTFSQAIERAKLGLHTIYTDRDKDRPSIICDNNGQTTLALCRVCNMAEIELTNPCRLKETHD